MPYISITRYLRYTFRLTKISNRFSKSCHHYLVLFVIGCWKDGVSNTVCRLSYNSHELLMFGSRDIFLYTGKTFLPNTLIPLSWKPGKRIKGLKTATVPDKSELRHTVFSLSGTNYVGEWKNNQIEGKGRQKTSHHYQYEGDWKEDKIHGFGVLSIKIPGEHDVFEYVYIGSWINGKREGTGEACYPDGSWYKGEFKNNKPNGPGYKMFADGSLFIGAWKDGTYNGIGLLIMANGNRYVGEWKYGMKHGRGKFYHLDTGQLQQGIWNNDMCICSEVRDLYYRQSVLHPTKYPIQLFQSDAKLEEKL